MDYLLGYHHRTKVFKHKDNKALQKLLSAIQKFEYPSEGSRKIKGGKKKSGVRDIIRSTFNNTLVDSWEFDIPLFDSSSIPASKIHYWQNKIGVIRSMAHRTTMGTDLLRLEVAYRYLDLIELGVFICCTSDFEKYYLGTEEKGKEQMVVFEELMEYLEMISDILTVPILIIGLKKPPKQRQTTL